MTFPDFTLQIDEADTVGILWQMGVDPTNTRQRWKMAQRAVRDYKKCERKLETIRWELGPPRGGGWVTRGSYGQMEQLYGPVLPELRWGVDYEPRRGLRTVQRTIRRYDRLLKRTHSLSLKALASLEPLRRVIRPGETFRDVLRSDRASA